MSKSLFHVKVEHSVAHPFLCKEMKAKTFQIIYLSQNTKTLYISYQDYLNNVDFKGMQSSEFNNLAHGPRLH